MLGDAGSTSPLTLDDAARRFVWNADHSFANSSPLYETLARAIAKDPELLSLAMAADRGQPMAVLFFGAVHDFFAQNRRTGWPAAAPGGLLPVAIRRRGAARPTR